MSDYPIDGATAPGLESVPDAFAANFADGKELGAAFAVTIEGETVVDLRGGFADRERAKPWDEETIACVYSSGKAVSALLIAEAVSEGRIDYDAPVAAYWPEFAARGKAAVTVAEALSHQAGLCGFTEPMEPDDWLDWDLICARLAAMAPLWPPGSASGYHPQTAGFIAGEIYRRATGRTIGAALRHRAPGIFCGLKPEEIERTAFMPKPPAAPDLGPLTDLKRAAFLRPWSAPAKVSREAWMAAELPASNMHASAAALARFMVPFANGGAAGEDGVAIDPDVVADALRLRISGPDLVLPFDLTWAAGLMANCDGCFGPSPTAVGHAGFGGSCVIVDPARRLTAAYVMGKMSPFLIGDPRAKRLIEATYAAIANRA